MYKIHTKKTTKLWWQRHQRSKRRKRYSMFMDKKTQYCQAICSSQPKPHSIPIPIKILASYFVDIFKLTLEFIWRSKQSRMSNSIQKENKVRGLTLPNFIQDFTIIKMMRHWRNKRDTDKWKRTDRLETDPHKYSQLILTKKQK